MSEDTLSTASRRSQLDMLHAQALAAAQRNDLTSALALFDRAIALDAGHAALHFNRAQALSALGQFQPALDSYRRSLELDPNFAQAFVNSAAILQRLGRMSAALGCYDRALRIAPTAQILFDKGVLLAGLSRLPEALASYEAALALQPDLAAAHSNRGIVLALLGRVEEAIESFDRAIAINPDFADAHYNKGKLLHEEGDFMAALASYDRSLEILPDLAEAHWNRAMVLMLTGDYERGLPDYEWRWRCEHWRTPEGSLAAERRIFEQPLWQGDTPIEGRTLFLYAEQGYGDTLQFVRYVALVAARGAEVILEVQRELVSLINQLPQVARVIARGDLIPSFDLHCPLASLPLAFKTSVVTIPAAPTYLYADADKVRHWRQRLAPSSNPRIGLVWSGRSTHVNDKNRSIPLAEWIPRLPPGFDYVGLQTEIRETDRAPLADFDIACFEKDLHDFSDTAALSACLDLIISVDTSVAHLSAALGLKTWILIPAIPDWRWLMERTDSPWYPSVRLFRQSRVGQWGDVLMRVNEELRALFGR